MLLRISARTRAPKQSPGLFLLLRNCPFRLRASKTHKQKTTRMGGFLFVVEMARVELASENLFPKLSTSVVYLLEFPWSGADKQASDLGSPLNRDKVQGYPLFTCTAK